MGAMDGGGIEVLGLFVLSFLRILGCVGWFGGVGGRE